ncbi:MAG TPA: ABC transporter ATP-binding protein [Polyangiaceae bacterium]|nr:ABC transporter ATP-binding protein [Polyangiaceae bacterium]
MIDLRNVTKTYGPVRALVGVDWRIEEGSVSVVQGSNGSGKSTLLSILGTLTRPTSGHVDHGSFGRTRREVRRNLGWLGHDSLCYPDLTGRENIELAARLWGADPVVAVGRAVERFDLGAFVDRHVRTYSKGQRQRVALARALVHSPRLLLLDEPTGGLDAASSARLQGVLEEEGASGATIVIVTHDPSLARGLGAAGITLERGRVTVSS